MLIKEKILENLINILKKLNNLEQPDQVTGILLKQSQLPDFFISFINSPYYNFDNRISKKENILFILGYKFLSAIILFLVLYIKYKDKYKKNIDKIFKEALKEGFKYSEAAKNEEAFLIGFISKIQKYFSQDDLEKIFKQADFPPSLFSMENRDFFNLIHNLNEKDLKNIEKYSQILISLTKDYVKKLGI